MGALDSGEVLVGERVYRDGKLEAQRDERIVVSDGESHIGVVALEATRLGRGPSVVVWQDGKELVISIVNYEGTARVFWEYRSLAGPFF
jgi:hypothetical protein